MILILAGTGTEVGKTHAGCALLKAARSRNLRVCAIKPVESGCQKGQHEDGVLLARASGQKSPLRALTRLRAPLAPCVAAEMEGVTLNPQDWVEEIRQRQKTCDFLLVETAGGLLSPITWDYDASDLARDLDAAVLVVAANHLGCLHDARSVVSVLHSQGTPVAGILLNAVQPDSSSSSNLMALQRVLPNVKSWSLPHDPGGESHETLQIMAGIIAGILPA